MRYPLASTAPIPIAPSGRQKPLSVTNVGTNIAYLGDNGSGLNGFPLPPGGSTLWQARPLYAYCAGTGYETALFIQESSEAPPTFAKTGASVSYLGRVTLSSSATIYDVSQYGALIVVPDLTGAGVDGARLVASWRDSLSASVRSLGTVATFQPDTVVGSWVLPCILPYVSFTETAFGANCNIEFDVWGTTASLPESYTTALDETYASNYIEFDFAMVNGTVNYPIGSRAGRATLRIRAINSGAAGGTISFGIRRTESTDHFLALVDDTSLAVGTTDLTPTDFVVPNEALTLTAYSNYATGVVDAEIMIAFF